MLVIVLWSEMLLLHFTLRWTIIVFEGESPGPSPIDIEPRKLGSTQQNHSRGGPRVRSSFMCQIRPEESDL